jgi:hypothetical protein
VQAKLSPKWSNLPRIYVDLVTIGLGRLGIEDIKQHLTS